MLLWAVIAVLVVGALTGGALLANKVNQLGQDNEELTGSNASLREQLRQAKTSPRTSTIPSPSPSAAPTPTTSPKASALPTPTPTTSPNTNPQQ